MTRGWLIALATALLLTLAPVPANAGGSADCDAFGLCGTGDSSGGGGGGGGNGGGGGGGGGKPKLPDCGSVNGYDSVPAGEDPAGWVEIACTEGGIRVLLWVRPGSGMSAVNPELVARSLLAQVQLEPIEIGLAPKGADAMALVGLPVWLWVDDPDRTTWGPATISAGGMTLTAQAESVVWTMGDGKKVSCGKGTEWKRGMGGGESPTCGHVYSRQGQYTVTATTHWMARWSGYGQSGSIPVLMSSSRPLDVGELQVIVTRGGE